MNSVTIGIQARSTSKRFPGKVFQMLGNKTILRHVIDSCQKAAFHINNFGSKRIHVDLALCIPYDDPIKRRSWGDIKIIEGPEEDVLMRYMMLGDQNPQSEYIVRVTGDCPLIPSFVISKCITAAVMNEYDYFSNVDERFRTAPDGYDCEVFTKKLLNYTSQNAIKPNDREHVTTFMRSNPPQWVKQGTLINFLNLSQLKISLDTPEDLENIKRHYYEIQDSFEKAKSVFGRENVQRY